MSPDCATGYPAALVDATGALPLPLEVPWPGYVGALIKWLARRAPLHHITTLCASLRIGYRIKPLLLLGGPEHGIACCITTPLRMYPFSSRPVYLASLRVAAPDLLLRHGCSPTKKRRRTEQQRIVQRSGASLCRFKLNKLGWSRSRCGSATAER